MDKGSVATGGYGGRDVNGARGGILPSELGYQRCCDGSGLSCSGRLMRGDCVLLYRWMRDEWESLICCSHLCSVSILSLLFSKCVRIRHYTNQHRTVRKKGESFEVRSRIA